MIDSINFIIRDIEYVDFKYLVQLGAYAKRYNNRRKNFQSFGYRFKYKNIEFKYNKSYRNITIITNAHKVLGKQDIHISDLKEYKTRVADIVKEVLPYPNIRLELSRIDFCVDLLLNPQIISRYIFLLNMHKKDYKYMKMKNKYHTSIHKSNSEGKFNLNIYSRYPYTGAEEDKNVLRIEVQVKKAKIKDEYFKYGIYKELDSYWTKDIFYENTIELLKDFLYEGNYYSKEKAKEIIMNSDLKTIEKRKLYRFLLRVERFGIDEVVKVKKFYCKKTVDKYIRMLNELSINPILLPRIWTDCDEMKNLLALAADTAEEKYFN